MFCHNHWQRYQKSTSGNMEHVIEFFSCWQQRHQSPWHLVASSIECDISCHYFPLSLFKWYWPEGEGVVVWSLSRTNSTNCLTDHTKSWQKVAITRSASASRSGTGNSDVLVYDYSLTQLIIYGGTNVNVTATMTLVEVKANTVGDCQACICTLGNSNQSILINTAQTQGVLYQIKGISTASWKRVRNDVNPGNMRWWGLPKWWEVEA